MTTLLMLYPAYGTVSCHEVCRHAETLGDMKLILADDNPTTSDLDIFDEVWELPPPEQVAEAYDLLRRWCDRSPPDGVFLQSEKGLLPGSLLADEYGLKGPSVKAAHLCSNKYLQRTALSAAGVGNPLFELAEQAEDVRRLGRRFGFPLVLKCVISTMSRLVTLVPDMEHVDGAVARMHDGMPKSPDVRRLLGFARAGKVDLGCDPTRQFLVESFLDGDMVETDGFVIGGRPHSFGVTEQVQSVDPPFFIEAYLLPAECADPVAVEAESDKALKAIGLQDSAFSVEMRTRDGVTRIIEVNGRLGWDDGFSELFKVRTYQERIVQAQQLALGLEPDLKIDASRRAALVYYPCYYDGMVEELPARDELVGMQTDDLRLGLATHRGAKFVAPPSPEAYPHVAWALATHPSSSRAAHGIAKRALDDLRIHISRI